METLLIACDLKNQKLYKVLIMRWKQLVKIVLARNIYNFRRLFSTTNWWLMKDPKAGDLLEKI